MTFYFLQLVSISFVYSPPQDITFPEFNCYKSFSSPSLFLKLFFHSFSGPEYIVITFIYNIEYFDPARKFLKHGNQLHFKKISGSCEEENIIITTHGLNYKELKISFIISLSASSSPIAYIHYTFEMGFKDNKYLLMDEYGNFAISAIIKHSSDKFLETVVGDIDEAYLYFRSIKSNSNHICIITKNNHSVIIPFLVSDFKPYHYIKNVMIKLNDRRKDIKFDYPAYLCVVPYDYSKKTIFITEEKSKISFFANYEIINSEDQRISQNIKFNSTNFEVIAYNREFIAPPDTNIVFLMSKKKENIVILNGGEKITQYKSKRGYPYYAEKTLEVEVEPHVKTTHSSNFSI